MAICIKRTFTRKFCVKLVQSSWINGTGEYRNRMTSKIGFWLEVARVFNFRRCMCHPLKFETLQHSSLTGYSCVLLGVYIWIYVRKALRWKATQVQGHISTVFDLIYVLFGRWVGTHSSNFKISHQKNDRVYLPKEYQEVEKISKEGNPRTVQAPTCFHSIGT